MAAITHDAKLNALLIDLGRSLLQYAAESSLWTREPLAEEQLLRLATIQRRHVSRLTELLASRGWPVEFGVYPTEYTDYHFVALEYLLPRMISAQAEMVAELDEAVHTCVDDPAAVDLLRDLLRGERAILEGLRSLKLSPLGPAVIASNSATNDTAV